MAKYRYVALLRGINVGGNAIIKMADLRVALEALGLADVVTYIQSGNVVFGSDETDQEKLARQIEQHLEASFGFKLTVFVLTPSDLTDAVAHNPFEPQRLEAEQRCQLMFLTSEPDRAHVASLMALEGPDYKFHVHSKVMYFAYPRAFESPARRNLNFEKILGVVGTARTFKVIDKLIELAVE